MGRNKIDLTGKKFGMLKAVSIDHKKGTRVYWNCVCECGGKRIVSNDHLQRLENTDCGCTRRHKANWKKHGMSNTRLYRIWSLMKERCYNSKRKEYKDYGGRGISVCKEWMDSKIFIEWALNNGYSDELTIDRIDNNKNYCPDNCRWISKAEQMNNKRSCHYITYNGETKTITQWAKDNNLTYAQLRKRLFNLNWDFETAITTPIKTNRKEG